MGKLPHTVALVDHPTFVDRTTMAVKLVTRAETWCYNMAASMEEDLPPLKIKTAHSNITKTQLLLSSGDYTPLKTYQ